MDQSLLKKNLQSAIIQSISLVPQTTYNGLNIYRDHFGVDDFFHEAALSFSQQGPLVSLICLNCADSEIDEFLSRQLYANLEVVRTTPDNSFADIIDYISSANSKYLCFFEPNHRYDSSKIFDMVYSLESLPSVDLLICARYYSDKAGDIIAPSELPYSKEQPDVILDGTSVLQNSINEHRNLFGNLSTLMCTTSYSKKLSFDLPGTQFNAINSLAFLFHMLVGAKIHIMPTPLALTLLQPYTDDAPMLKAYREFADSFAAKNSISISPFWKSDSSFQPQQIFPEITFFYTDMGEYYNLEPIAAEAARRGYQTVFTQDIKQKAEIGIYCQHQCYPENSKFSVILLHDMAQGHNRWPNIWYVERWNKFDLGIVPGQLWNSLWTQCACQYYANPRHGIYELGYPKSDLVDSPSLEKHVQELRAQFNFKYNFSILYAPSWENDGKEDDFVCALSSLPVNLLIKQAHWPAGYEHIIHNIEQMRAMHENKYDNVYYVEPTESIITALKLCDMVVSDESSVMVEALMFHKPSIAVIDWLIPDTTPARHAIVPMDCVVKCKKVQLREYAEKMFSNPSYYHSILEKGSQFFSNQGSVCKDIMDAIEYYTEAANNSNKKTDYRFLSKKVTQKYATCSLWN